ncbi:hypothetical protein Q7C36_012478 [Tachysurus vachellii]|uniref:Costars family protein ABRACL n=1 Tax=Tachysurus vachellii TaxID=175792 RepID=A0AA88SJ14_TACVA|nr:hypothetical protein Q7C36_012478 [Tachysurus vachellii]
MNVNHEVTLLVNEIHRLGNKTAKRKKIITFQGELLLQGVYDNVDSILLHY